MENIKDNENIDDDHVIDDDDVFTLMCPFGLLYLEKYLVLST